MDRKTGQWMNANGCARRGSSGRFGGCIGRCNGGARVDPRGTGHPSWGTVGGRGSRQRAEITLPRVRLIPRDDGPSRGAWAGARRGPIARFHVMPGSVIAASAFPTIGANEIAAPRSRRACPLKPPNHPPRASSGKRNKFAGQSGNPTAAAGRRVGHDSPMRCQRRTTTSVVASSRPYTRDARGRRVCGTAADGVRCFIQNRVGALLLQLFHPCRVTVRTRRRSINPKSTRRSARRGAHHLGWRINIEISPKQALSYVHNSYFAFL